MMHIALLVSSLYSQGAEYVTAAMARGLSARGHSVDVLVSAIHADFMQSLKDRNPFEIGDNARLVQLPGRRARENFMALRKYISVSRPDVVLCNADPYCPILLAANLSLLARCRSKIVNVEHLGGVGLDRNGNADFSRPSFKRRMLNRFLLRLDAIFSVSEGTRRALNRVRGYPLEKIFTVYNPAVDALTYQKMRAQPMHPWLREREKPVFVAAGAFAAIKGHAILIKALKKLSRYRDCRLVIFGDGPLRHEYERLIAELGLADRVSLPGYTDNLVAELKAASACVVSSVMESFSVVLVEALACGIPVVSTDAPYGPREILRDGQYGILVERNNPEALAAGMERALADPYVRPPIESYERFSAERVVVAYERALEKVML